MEPEPIPPPSKERHWDIDEPGEGVADASAAAGRIDELRAHAERPRWIAEQPEIHLWPHLERAISADGSGWVGTEHSVDADGRFVVDLVHERMSGDRVRAALQAEVLGLLGLVVEAATFIEIEERAGDDRLVVDVVTLVLDHQSPFKAHGHTIRFRVTTAR